MKCFCLQFPGKFKTKQVQNWVQELNTKRQQHLNSSENQASDQVESTKHSKNDSTEHSDNCEIPEKQPRIS